MPKLVLALDDKVIEEYELTQDELKLGRRSSNEIQIQNLTVSGKHARIIKSDKGYSIEDLNSTNGTYVNGKLIKQHALSDGDEIMIGKYKLSYVAQQPAEQPPTLASLLHTNTEEEAGSQGDNSESNYSSAIIEVKNGAKAGQILPLQKPVTTLGRPGIQIAAIMKKPEGYFFMHIESEEEGTPPQHNRTSLGEEPVLLKSGDSLTVAGIHVEFMLS